MGVSRLDSVTFSTITANGNPPSTPVSWLAPVNGLVTVSASGTFGGGTISIEISHDGGATWVPASGIALSAAGSTTIQLVAAGGIRPKMTGATSPSVVVQMSFVDY